MRKRLCVFALALCFVVSMVLYPLRARAMAGALTAVGAAVTVSAFLMACGIYPYISEDGQSFGEWGAQSLYDLWGQYVDSFEGGQLPSGGTVETFNQIKSFVVGGTLAIASGTWETLRGFASWIVSHFSLTDNQSGVFLGVSVRGAYPINFTGQTFDSISSSSRYSYIVTNGTYLGHDSSLNAPLYMMYFGFSGNPSDIGVYYISNSSTLTTIQVISTRTFDNRPVGYVTKDRYGDNYAGAESWYSNSVSPKTFTFDGISYRIWGAENYYANVRLSTVPADAKVFPSISEAVKDLLGITDTNDFYGITADTGTVTPLEALPADTPWGGLAVQGTLNPAGTVEQGVTDRAKPVVRPVEVEIGAGMEVDSETGEITENPVVITPQSVPLVVSDYQIAGLSSVFPFSIPWDIARVFQAFDAAPRCPLDDWSVTLPFGGLGLASENPTVSFNLSQLPEVRQKIDQIAVVCRSLLLVLACLLWLLFLAKFVRF